MPRLESVVPGHTTAVPRLRRVNCATPGLTRRRRGRGFSYADARGRTVSDRDTLVRIRDLAIPPAWEDVWISADPLGHLQAVGSDAKGRRQYLYHEHWRVRRDLQKFDRMLEFGAMLPKIRHHYGEALHLRGLPDERVVACGVALIDLGLFRIGSPAYTRDNGTFGLCTVERRHVRVVGGVARFDFPAKTGRRWVVDVREPSVVDALSHLKARRGGSHRLLVAQSASGWREVQPGDINGYIKGVTGAEFSAKDFRTWNATVLAAAALAGASPDGDSARARKAAVNGAVAEVAASLGNTPTVARRSYIDPRVVDRFLEGKTIAPVFRGIGDADQRQPAVRQAIEDAVLDLLS